MRVLLVSPATPPTYWGFQRSLRIVGKSVSLPPLGLLTLAALLPREWELRLVDLDARSLSDEEIRWADAVLVGGMLLQSGSIVEVLARARSAGRRTAVGGPAATASPELFPDADVVFRGEAEGRAGSLVAALASGRRELLSAPAGAFPDLAGTPLPRFDLLDLPRYASMSVQFSRGCPYTCEFCDIIEMFGRKARVKPVERVLAELDALHALGWRGSVFFVDDNFIGNRPAVRALLPRLEGWQEERGRPFELYTEAGVALAGDGPLMEAMVRAGFTAVFLGIETPSRESLAGANKRQNLAIEPRTAVAALTRAGLEVMGGFIVGFDGDGPGIFAAQNELIDGCPMPFAMIGLLNAPPGTALKRRLESEGRLREMSAGDQFARPNFRPAMDEEVLLRGYSGLLRDVYSSRSYYRRCEALVKRLGPSPHVSGRSWEDAMAFLRAVVAVGVASPRRWLFWRLLLRAASVSAQAFRRAVVLGVKGEHVITYTREAVLPRIEAAVHEVQRERARMSSRRHANHRLEPGQPWPDTAVSTPRTATGCG